MKGPTNVQIRPQTRYFISHMVQMKAEKDITSSKEPADFISHMVQMKEYFLKLS